MRHFQLARATIVSLLFIEQGLEPTWSGQQSSDATQGADHRQGKGQGAILQVPWRQNPRSESSSTGRRCFSCCSNTPSATSTAAASAAWKQANGIRGDGVGFRVDSGITAIATDTCGTFYGGADIQSRISQSGYQSLKHANMMEEADNLTSTMNALKIQLDDRKDPLKAMTDIKKALDKHTQKLSNVQDAIEQQLQIKKDDLEIKVATLKKQFVECQNKLMQTGSLAARVVNFIAADSDDEYMQDDHRPQAPVAEGVNAMTDPYSETRAISPTQPFIPAASQSPVPRVQLAALPDAPTPRPSDPGIAALLYQSAAADPGEQSSTSFKPIRNSALKPKFIRKEKPQEAKSPKKRGSGFDSRGLRTRGGSGEDRVSGNTAFQRSS